MKQPKKLLKIFISIFFSVVFSLSIGSSALAWNYYDSEWYYGVDPLYYQYYPNTSQDVQDYFTMAAYYWDSAANSPTDFVYTTSGNPYDVNVFCYQVNNPELDQVSGKTYYVDSEGFITWAYSWLNVAVIYNYSVDDRISVAGHELGHALGHDENLSSDPIFYIMDDRDNVRSENDIISPQYYDIYYLNLKY